MQSCLGWASAQRSAAAQSSIAKTTFTRTCQRAIRSASLKPLSLGEGTFEIQLEDGSTRSIGITRAHLEEDAGKSLHEDFHGQTGIDLNRAGTPLLEIVSEPDLRTAAEAVAYLKAMHSLVTYLGISDGNMAEGSMRCDINISLRPVGSQTLGTRAEIKNVNSFRFVEKAIRHELARQADILDDGGKIVQETRLYDADLR